MKIGAKLRLLPTEEGGRRSPVATGSLFTFALEPETTSLHFAHLEIIGKDMCAPGEECDFLLEPAAEEYWRNVTPGDWLAIQEGNRITGLGEISAVEY